MQRGRFWPLLALVFVAISFVGCGNNDGAVSASSQSVILSDQRADGDIILFASGAFSVRQNLTLLAYGIDPATSIAEQRCFLDFFLRGPGGVPRGAEIVSASINIFINRVAVRTRVPTLVELVDYPPFDLAASDFDSNPFAARPVFEVSALDADEFIDIDVTGLLREAQRRGFDDLQLRFLLNFSVNSGFVEIDDSDAVAPQLTVRWR